MKEEILRKLIHLSSLSYPVLYYLFFTKNEMIALITLILIGVLIIDFTRLRTTFLNNFFKIILRENEKNGGLSGATFFMIGLFFTISFFSKNIAIISICVLVISDTCAAIFGKLIPSKKIVQKKSIAGTASFLISSIAIVLFFKMPILITSCFITTLIELYAKKIKIDDNILIPLTFATFSYLLTSYF